MHHPPVLRMFGVQISQVMPPIRVQGTLRPIAMYPSPTDPSTFVFDFGQNFAGWVQLQLTGQSPGNAANMCPNVLMHMCIVLCMRVHASDKGWFLC